MCLRHFRANNTYQQCILDICNTNTIYNVCFRGWLTARLRRAHEPRVQLHHADPLGGELLEKPCRASGLNPSEAMPYRPYGTHVFQHSPIGAGPLLCGLPRALPLRGLQPASRHRLSFLLGNFRVRVLSKFWWGHPVPSGRVEDVVCRSEPQAFSSTSWAAPSAPCFPAPLTGDSRVLQRKAP